MQQVRHLAAGKLFFRFGVGVVTISSTCSRKVIAIAHSAVVLTAHVAEVAAAGNLAVVRTVFQGAFVFAAHTVGARTVASNPAGVMASDHNAAFVIAAHAADIRVSGHIGTRDGDFFYGADCGAIRANAAEQANVARSAINVQPADGMVLTVKGACKRLVFCADGRPRIEAGVGVQAAVVV